MFLRNHSRGVGTHSFGLTPRTWSCQKLFCFLLVSVSWCAQAGQIQAIRLNNKGVQALKDKNAGEAQRQFLQSLSEKPLQGAVKLNLGLAFEDEKKIDQALKDYDSVLRLSSISPTVKMAALVNAANIYGERQKYDKALSYYQQALQIDPNSKEIKTNIELLWQQKPKGGGGDGKKPPKDPKDKNKQQKPGQGPPQKPKPRPKKFKSKELSKNDVKRILEEIKNQEQKIRAKEYQKNLKEPAREKDW